jgi:hypothetical protein
VLRSKFAQALQLLRRYQARIEELGQVACRALSVLAPSRVVRAAASRTPEPLHGSAWATRLAASHAADELLCARARVERGRACVHAHVEL